MDDRAKLGTVDEVWRQQATIAEFGAMALAADDLDDLLTKACTLAAEGLRVTHAKVLVPGGENGRLVVRAGVGWDDGVVGKATLGGDLDSPGGYALRTGWPVISSDFSQESRFKVPSLLSQHGIQSAVNVIIRSQAQPFGVLEVDATEPRPFTQHDVNFLQSFANLLAAALERLRTQADYRELAAENARIADRNELLLRELHHRVNNNLGQIGALLRLQKANAASADERRAVETIEARLNAMRILYGSLKVNDVRMTTDLGAYLTGLAESLQRLATAQEVEFKIDVCQILVTPDLAVPLGLIVNEFVTNSLKHAFTGARGVIALRLEPAEDGEVRLELSDNGAGMPAVAPTRPGLGLTLISRLAEQIGAKIEWAPSGGTRLVCRLAKIP